MEASPRSQLPALLGLGGLFLASTGCFSCGATWVFTAFLGALAVMTARRAALRAPDPWSADRAWASVGLWSGAVALFGSILALTGLYLPILGWIGGIAWLASL
jgi:hypothetical protein